MSLHTRSLPVTLKTHVDVQLEPGVVLPAGSIYQGVMNEIGVTMIGGMVRWLGPEYTITLEGEHQPRGVLARTYDVTKFVYANEIAVA
jgi:hypothetical protein